MFILGLAACIIEWPIEVTFKSTSFSLNISFNNVRKVSGT